jgi:hypothetical protein
MTWPKQCACCKREYTPLEWWSLKLRGWMGGAGRRIELRDCGGCANTLAIEVPL